MSDGVQLSCPCCGTHSDLEEFCKTEVSGDLPYGQYQCPWCRYAFRRRTKPGRVLHCGIHTVYHPGDAYIEQVEAVL